MIQCLLANTVQGLLETIGNDRGGPTTRQIVKLSKTPRYQPKWSTALVELNCESWANQSVWRHDSFNELPLLPLIISGFVSKLILTLCHQFKVKRAWRTFNLIYLVLVVIEFVSNELQLHLCGNVFALYWRDKQERLENSIVIGFISCDVVDISIILLVLNNFLIGTFGFELFYSLIWHNTIDLQAYFQSKLDNFGAKLGDGYDWNYIINLKLKKYILYLLSETWLSG